MAVALVILVILDTAATSYMMARQRHMSQRMTQLEEATKTNARIVRDIALTGDSDA